MNIFPLQIRKKIMNKFNINDSVYIDWNACDNLISSYAGMSATVQAIGKRYIHFDNEEDKFETFVYKLKFSDGSEEVFEEDWIYYHSDYIPTIGDRVKIHERPTQFGTVIEILDNGDDTTIKLDSGELKYYYSSDLEKYES